MSVVAYILISVLALLYAYFAWKLYPHLISIKDRVVKSRAQLYWARLTASWGVFAFIVLIIPLAWSDFDAQVHSFVGGVRHTNAEPRLDQSASPTTQKSADATTVPHSIPEIPARPTSNPGEPNMGVSQVAATPIAESVSLKSESSSDASRPEMQTSASTAGFMPSFDCAKASSGAERLICSNQQLASLDVQLMQVYGNAMSVAPNKGSLKASQIDWIKSDRDACSTAECMIRAYMARIRYLKSPTP
jgi:uncharacterized protein YecT (DUF1311 family)